MTVYQQGVAEVLEERLVVLQPGTNAVEWRSLLPGAILRTVRVTVEGGEVTRQDITQDGDESRQGRRAVLHLTLTNKGAAGPKRVQVDYLVPAFDWDSDYVLVLDTPASGAPPTTGRLESWFTVRNASGADVSAELLELIAGEMQLRSGGQPMLRGDFSSNVASQRMAGPSDWDQAPQASGVSGLSAFQRYTVGNGISLNANAIANRFPLLQPTQIAVEQRLVFENGWNEQTQSREGFTLLPRGLEVRIIARNTTNRPLPAGVAHIYATSAGGTQLVGEDLINHTAELSEFTLSQGRSSTVFGTRRIVDRVEDRISPNETRLTTSIELVITNRGKVPMEVYLRERVEPHGRNRWSIQSATTSEKLAANLAQFRVTVPAGEKTVVTYSVQNY
jgi:hypothetical protein